MNNKEYDRIVTEYFNAVCEANTRLLAVQQRDFRKNENF